MARLWGLLLPLAAACGGGAAPGAGPADPGFNVGPGAPLAIAGTPLREEEALFDEVPGKAGSHAPAITAFPDGELLAAWYSYDGPHELDGSAIYLARRPAGGGWTAPWQHIDRPAGDGNPVLYSEGDAVWLFQAVTAFRWSTARIDTQRSPDRGRTWTPPETIEAPLGANVRAPPVKLTDGTLLLPAYSDLARFCLFFHSADGVAWTLRAELFAPPGSAAIQPSVATVGGGSLRAVMHNPTGGWMWTAASDDEGRSWTLPGDAGFENHDSAVALARLASGNLLLVYVASATGTGPLHVALSADDGRTWPAQRVLTAGEKDSYPAVVQSPDGLVHVVYSTRLRIRHVTTNEAWIAAE